MSNFKMLEKKKKTLQVRLTEWNQVESTEPKCKKGKEKQLELERKEKKEKKKEKKTIYTFLQTTKKKKLAQYF